MRKQFIRKALILLAIVAAILAALAGPVATWLQDRGSWLGVVDARVDAVYMMAGQWNHERVDGLVDWLSRGGETGRILLPDDPSKGRWSRQSQRNLSAVEWTQDCLHKALIEKGLNVTVEVVPIRLDGTDAEMTSLGLLLKDRPELRIIALTTSRFHIRRARCRAGKHLGGKPAVIPAIGIWQDRSPWVVGVEMVKMLRDAVGLSNAPLLHRGWWRAGLAREKCF